jgi:serine/threonine-protein kinase
MAVATIKGYRVEEKVKDGSVGTVWRVTNSKLQTLALKQISAENARDSRKISQFKREFTVTQGLQHPHVIRVFDYVPLNPQHFFTMEYFESESLKYAMFHAPEYVEGREFTILRELAQALEYVHSKGIIHKDLKPENVLVNAEGDLRLIDFSLSQTKWDRMLQFGKKVEGTPMYMPPEQVRGEKCDVRTDVYAFGLIAYELLAKKVPFASTYQYKLMEMHLRETPPPLKNHQPSIAPDLELFVLRMLQKSPDRRPQSMTDVIHELSKWEKKDSVVRRKQIRPTPAVDRENPSPLQEAASTSF